MTPKSGNVYKAAEVGGVTPARIRQLLAADKIAGEKINQRGWNVNLASVERWRKERDAEIATKRKRMVTKVERRKKVRRSKK